MKRVAQDKTGVEGTMFLVLRSAPPLHALFILNRSNLNNLSISLIPDMEIDVEGDYVIYR